MKQVLSEKAKEKIKEEIDYKIASHVRWSNAHDSFWVWVITAVFIIAFLFIIYNMYNVSELSKVECDSQTKFCPNPLACVSGYCVADIIPKDEGNWECFEWENRTEVINVKKYCVEKTLKKYGWEYTCGNIDSLECNEIPLQHYEECMDCLTLDTDGDGYTAINRTHCIKEMNVRDV